MMGLTILSTAQVTSVIENRWGALDTDEALADLLRAEVTARANCTRWAALRRIVRAASPFAGADLDDRLSTACSSLEAEGDLSSSSGGVLHVSPLRAIELQAAEYRIVSSLPTHRLIPKLPGNLDALGVRRTLRFEAGQSQEVADAIAALGGLVISPEAWAGLELSPCADARWLKSLEDRLEWQPEPAGSLERDGPLDWSTLLLTDSGPRWKRRSEDMSRLWRARNHLERWAWAWSVEGQPPSSGSFVSLTSDDASRTVFALARVAEDPIACVLEHVGEVARLSLREWLPRAEYRYLATLATASRVDGQQQWTIPSSRVDDVMATLGLRLGLIVTNQATV